MAELDAGGGDLCVARVIAEDDDYLTLEVGKNDDVKWYVAPMPGEVDPKPQRFYVLLFVKEGRVWKPWED